MKIKGFRISCLADLNRRPPPYQGDALPTEPRQHTYFFLSHKYVFYQISFSLSTPFCYFFKQPPKLTQFISLAQTSRFIPASFRGFYSEFFEVHYQWILAPFPFGGLSVHNLPHRDKPPVPDSQKNSASPGSAPAYGWHFPG